MPDKEALTPAHFTPNDLHPGGIPGLAMFPQAELGYRFYNGLSVEVTVVTRTGVHLKIPPVPGARHRVFVVRSTYSIGHGVIVDSRDLWNDKGTETSKEAEVLDKVLYPEARTFGRGAQRHSQVDYTISKGEFDELGGSLYLTNLDLTLSTLNSFYAPSHPYSLAGLRDRAVVDNSPGSETHQDLMFGLRIIDREGRFGVRYMNLSGHVLVVPVVRQSELRDGVYLTTSQASYSTASVTGTTTRYLSFAEAEKELKLYLSHREALTLGDIDGTREIELKERAHAIKMKEQDLRERDFELSRLEQDFKYRDQKLKEEHLRLKDLFDRRSATRKEFLEVLKFVPMALAGLGAALATVKAFKK